MKFTIEIDLDDEYLYTLQLIQRAATEKPCNPLLGAYGDRFEKLQFWGMATVQNVGPLRKYNLTQLGIDILRQLSA